MRFDNGQFRLGDCLELMKDIPSGSIDMILCDLPYGTTACKWDTVIPFEPLWKQYWRIAKPNAAIVLTASQPFTSALVMSEIVNFRHEWIWIKNRGSNFANTVREPMKEHESILVFSKGKWTYNKQMQIRSDSGLARAAYDVAYNDSEREGYRKFEGREHHRISELRVPASHQKFNIATGYEKQKHPTQKPVALFEYLIKTYTNPGETVMDNCAGSGTTAIAAERTGRRWLCMEKDQVYYNAAIRRVANEYY